MSLELHRISASDYPSVLCGGCRQQITDPSSAHRGGESHPSHDRCWRVLAETTPGGECQVTCFSCPSNVDTSSLFSWKEKAEKIGKSIFKNTAGAMELAAQTAREGTVLGLSCVTGIKIGDLTFKLALKNPAFRALLNSTLIGLGGTIGLGLINSHVTNKVAKTILLIFACIAMLRGILVPAPKLEYWTSDVASMFISMAATIAAAWAFLVPNENGRTILLSAGLFLLMSGCIEEPTLGNESVFTFARVFLPFVFCTVMGAIACMQAQPQEGINQNVLRIGGIAGLLFGLSFFLPDRYTIENSGNLGVLNNNL